MHQFPADTSITASQTVLATPTINNIRQWDPDPSISLQTFQREQAIKGYYAFPSLGVDRYTVSGQVTPVLIGVRDISSANLASPSWVNTHLQYTHGNGAAVALANQNNTSNPVYAVQGVPPTSSNGVPAITQPNVYFGLGETGYVVANTKQLEVDYQENGTSVESHYKGTGGVQLSSIFKRAAFALRLGDFNLLISSQITDKSRIMFVRDPVSMAEKAAPFLTFDHDPYAVINSSPGPDHGHIDWIVDGYTTTANYPYSQNADSQQVAIGTNLPGSYNYVRNSVKVVIDAYSGKMTFYDADPKDPILQAYSAAFPNMFVPLSKMPTALQAHLRYPEDIFSIQSAIYGRYHLTNPQAFYSASSAWQLSPTAGAGPQSQALLAENTYNNQGQLVSTTPARMAPQYQVYSLPGTNQNKQVFTVSDGFVPASQSSLTSSGQNFNLTAWMVGLSDPGTLGQLDLYETPQGTTGPANADAEISADSTVSKDISLLDTKGSEVLLGETLMVPIANSMVYVRPLYVSPTTNPQPQLEYVIAVLGKNVQIDTSLPNVLSDLLGTTVLPPGQAGTSTGTVPSAVAGILQQAQTDYTNAQAALKADNLAAVPDGHRRDAGGDQPGAAGDRRHDARGDDGHHDHDDGAADQAQDHQEGRHDDNHVAPDDQLVEHHLGAGEHRAQERHDHLHHLLVVDHLVDAGFGGTPDLRGRAGAPPAPRGRSPFQLGIPVAAAAGASHDGCEEARGKEVFRWDCSTRSRRRRRRPRRWPRTRRPRARPR